MKKSVTIFHWIVNVALIIFCICAGILNKDHCTLYIYKSIMDIKRIKQNTQPAKVEIHFKSSIALEHSQ